MAMHRFSLSIEVFDDRVMTCLMPEAQLPNRLLKNSEALESSTGSCIF